MYPNTERRTLVRHVINAPGGNRVKTSVQFYGIQPRLHRQDIIALPAATTLDTDAIMTTCNFERTPGLARVTDIRRTHRVSRVLGNCSIARFPTIWWQVSYSFATTQILPRKSRKQISRFRHVTNKIPRPSGSDFWTLMNETGVEYYAGVDAVAFN